MEKVSFESGMEQRWSDKNTFAAGIANPLAGFEGLLRGGKREGKEKKEKGRKKTLPEIDFRLRPIVSDR